MQKRKLMALASSAATLTAGVRPGVPLCKTCQEGLGIPCPSNTLLLSSPACISHLFVKAVVVSGGWAASQVGSQLFWESHHAKPCLLAWYCCCSSASHTLQKNMSSFLTLRPCPKLLGFLCSLCKQEIPSEGRVWEQESSGCRDVHSWGV